MLIRRQNHFSRNQVATERQSFSELIPVTEGEKSNKNLNNKKRVHSRTRYKSRLNSLLISLVFISLKE